MAGKCIFCGKLVSAYYTNKRQFVWVNMGPKVVIIDEQGITRRGYVPHYATCSNPEGFTNKGKKALRKAKELSHAER